MARKQDIITDERRPVLFEVGERNRPVDSFGADVAACLKVESIFVGMLEEAFVESAIVIEGDFGVALENMRKGGEWISGGSGRIGGSVAIATNGNQIFERALGCCAVI